MVHILGKKHKREEVPKVTGTHNNGQKNPEFFLLGASSSMFYRQKTKTDVTSHSVLLDAKNVKVRTCIYVCMYMYFQVSPMQCFWGQTKGMCTTY